jgi:hypothetical protein
VPGVWACNASPQVEGECPAPHRARTPFRANRACDSPGARSPTAPLRYLPLSPCPSSCSVVSSCELERMACSPAQNPRPTVAWRRAEHRRPGSGGTAGRHGTIGDAAARCALLLLCMYCFPPRALSGRQPILADVNDLRPGCSICWSLAGWGRVRRPRAAWDSLVNLGHAARRPPSLQGRWGAGTLGCHVRASGCRWANRHDVLRGIWQGGACTAF